MLGRQGEPPEEVASGGWDGSMGVGVASGGLGDGPGVGVGVLVGVADGVGVGSGVGVSWLPVPDPSTGAPTTRRLSLTAQAVQLYSKSRGAGASRTMVKPVVLILATAALAPSDKKALSVAWDKLSEIVTTGISAKALVKGTSTLVAHLGTTAMPAVSVLNVVVPEKVTFDKNSTMSLKVALPSTVSALLKVACA